MIRCLQSYRRAFAAVALTAGVLGAGLVVAPAAQAATCSDLEVVFARGSGEAQGLGSVGQPLVTSVKGDLPSLNVTSYAVVYAASFNQRSAGPGATAMTQHVVSQAAACPNQKFALGGYSQGASVLDIAIGIRTSLGTGQVIPTSLAPRIIAVTAFGNPLGISNRQTIKQASALYGPKSIEFCNRGDQVCGSTGTGPGSSHLSYPRDGSTTTSARYIATKATG